MIISASRRTDIPAFYADWLFRRLEEGFCTVANPFNPRQQRRVELRPDQVDCLVFWTRNAVPMLSRLELLKDYAYYFQYTITGYGNGLEPGVPHLQQAIETFSSLAELIGAPRMVWRYDPVIFSAEFDLGYHVARFEHIALGLQGKTQLCVFSLVDYYSKVDASLKQIGAYEPDTKLMRKLATEMKQIIAACGMELVTCAEELELDGLGIGHGKCIDADLINRVFDKTLKVPKDSGQRKACGCVHSIDIGAYSTCPHGCVYCYANAGKMAVARNHSRRDPSAPCLLQAHNPIEEALRSH